MVYIRSNKSIADVSIIIEKKICKWRSLLVISERDRCIKYQWKEESINNMHKKNIMKVLSDAPGLYMNHEKMLSTKVCCYLNIRTTRLGATTNEVIYFLSEVGCCSIY